MTYSAVVEAADGRRPISKIWESKCRPSIATWLLLAFAVVASAAGPEASVGGPSGIKAFIDRPGVYAVEIRELCAPADCEAGFPVERLRLVCRGRPVPHWLEYGATATPYRVLFVADTAMFQPGDQRDGRPLRVVELTFDGGTGKGPASDLFSDPSVLRDGPGHPGLERASVRRRLHLEENLLRAAVTMGDADEVDTLWFWAMLTQQRSSQLEIEIGGIPDRQARGGPDLEVSIRLLGWSLTSVPEGVSQHHVDVFLNDVKVGEGDFRGRQMTTLHISDVSDTLLHADTNRLRVKVPERSVEGSGEPILDIVYLDWVELRYQAGSPLADGAAPVEVDASDTPRWLADPEGSPTADLMAASGWTAQRRAPGGWVVPAGEATELWIIDHDEIRTPLALEPLNTGVGPLPAKVEYVMITPPELAAGTERLAEFHRSLGRTVAVVDAVEVYDVFGGGEKSAGAIRRFLDFVYENSGRLRWVLLVGDADWFEPDDRLPYLRPDPADRNRIPAWTFLSSYGPAASDHFYAADRKNSANPRFAVGRLPVVDAATLDGYVSKVVAWAAAPTRDTAPSMLMLRDSSKGSQLQQERMRARLRGIGLDIFAPEFSSADSDLGEVAIAAFDRRPSVVYFGGHGSRFMWELGDPENPRPETFFDRDDVGRLEPTVRQPIALSMSCATAPFDHPSAGSLGETMVLSGSRGAVAFIGASAALFTPPRFGESLVRDLLVQETLGDAFVAAKRRTVNDPVSYLYNLLGDPGLPLSAQREDADAEEQ